MPWMGNKEKIRELFSSQTRGSMPGSSAALNSFGYSQVVLVLAVIPNVVPKEEHTW